jgi:tRNA pseudouridine38-40 synthase
VLQAEEVERRFHSRWDALAKTYQYRISRSPILSPFERLYALHCSHPLDEEAMAQCARLFEGIHDFTSFSAAGGDELDGHQPKPQREILRAEIVRCQSPSFSPLTAVENLAARLSASGRSEELIFLVRGKSFLRHMVRKMAGTLLDVGRGRLSLEDVRQLFEAPNRARSGPTAPPQGLCLVSVEYPEPWRIGQP